MSIASQHPDTDGITEYNGRCKGCIYSFFNHDKTGRRIFKIGKCKAKDKYIVSSKHVGNWDCEKFKKIASWK